jgi:hypothetical protein
MILLTYKVFGSFQILNEKLCISLYDSMPFCLAYSLTLFLFFKKPIVLLLT